VPRPYLASRLPTYEANGVCLAASTKKYGVLADQNAQSQSPIIIEMMSNDALHAYNSEYIPARVDRVLLLSEIYEESATILCMNHSVRGPWIHQSMA
jgi:hypothetical protein